MNDTDDIYKDIEEYNSNNKRKILVVFDDLIVFSEVETKQFFVFIKQSYFTIFYYWLFYTHCLIMKVPNKRGLRHLIIHYIYIFKDFINL